MYNLEMWDTRQHYLHKFDYILPACVKNCDVILFFFSITDRYDIFKPGARRPHAPGFLKSLQCGCVCVCVCVCVRPRGHE